MRKVQGIVVLVLSVPVHLCLKVSHEAENRQSGEKFLVSPHFASGEVKGEDTEILDGGEAFFKILFKLLIRRRKRERKEV